MPANFTTIEATEFTTIQAAVQTTDFAPDVTTIINTIKSANLATAGAAVYATKLDSIHCTFASACLEAQ
jgi:hypothetical protein